MILDERQYSVVYEDEVWAVQGDLYNIEESSRAFFAVNKQCVNCPRGQQKGVITNGWRRCCNTMVESDSPDCQTASSSTPHPSNCPPISSTVVLCGPCITHANPASGRGRLLKVLKQLAC
jgi:hypothetical protein